MIDLSAIPATSFSHSSELIPDFFRRVSTDNPIGSFSRQVNTSSSGEPFARASKLSTIVVSLEEVRTEISQQLETKTFNQIMDHMEHLGSLQADGKLIKLVNFVVQLNERQTEIYESIKQVYRNLGYTAPTLKEVCEAVQANSDTINAMIQVGIARNEIVMLDLEQFYLTETLDSLKGLVAKSIEKEGAITVAQFRDATNSSRKFALMVLEYFDRVRFTRRVGDARVLF